MRGRWILNLAVPAMSHLLSRLVNAWSAVLKPPDGSVLHTEAALDLYCGLAVGVCAVGASCLLMDEVRGASLSALQLQSATALIAVFCDHIPDYRGRAWTSAWRGGVEQPLSAHLLS
eukprot:SAG31_NODE_4278_length_3384_cov_1.471537_2_plen_117_part_00